MSKYTIECSLGEIIDKISILKIKLEKSEENTDKYNNIKKEYESLLSYKENNKKLNSYFDELYDINKILWDLEDKIRLKSSTKIFDQSYINTAELIHITNDKRYQTKREINLLYKSNFIEEKIFSKDIIKNKQKKFKDKQNLENMCDKTIIIIGPAGYIENYNMENIIERADFVIRPNCKIDLSTNKLLLPKYTTTRCDIIYHSGTKEGDKIIGYDGKVHNLHAQASLDDKTLVIFKKNQVKIIVLAQLNRLKKFKTLKKIDGLNLFKAKNIFNEEAGFTTGMKAIIDILKYKPKKLIIFGFDFYKTNNHAFDGYYKNMNNIDKRFHGRSAVHNIDKELEYFYKNIFIQHNNVIIDSHLKKIIEELYDIKINENKHIKLISQTNENKQISYELSSLIEVLNIFYKTEFYKSIKKNKYNLNKISKKDRRNISSVLKKPGKISNENKLKDLISKNNNWFMPNYYLAKYYIIQNQYDKASIYFKKTIEIKNTDININIEYARFLNKTSKNLNLILIQWLYCIRLDSKLVEPYENIINLILREKCSLQHHKEKYDNFIQLINIGMNNNPDNIILMNGMARFYEMINELSKTLDYHFKCLKIQPKNAKLLYNIGLTIAKSSNKNNESIDYFLKALNIDNSHDFIYNDIIVYYSKNNNFDESLKYSLEAYNKLKTNKFLFKVCSSYLGSYKLDKAEETTLKLLKLDKDNKFIKDCYLILAKINKYKRDFVKGNYYYDYLIKNLYVLCNDTSSMNNIKNSYSFYLFRMNKYIKGYDYLVLMNRGDMLIENIELSPKKIRFFDKNDKNKILMIFNCGFGDTIMYGRFIDNICKTYNENKIIFVINSKLNYLFKYADFIKNKNLTLMIEKEAETKYNVNINYYCDGSILNKYLNLDYSKIYFNPYFINIPDNGFYQMLSLQMPKNTKKICINWHGNRDNPMEKFRRAINLELLVPLFKIPNIIWISIQKEITAEEKQILKENNVLDTSEYIDNGENAYIDTISLFYACDLVISTDTSTLHLGATMNINIWGLIGYYCEWRWGLEGNSIWYPHVKLYRQDKSIDWKNVINELTNNLTYNLEESCLKPKEILLKDNYEIYTNLQQDKSEFESVSINRCISFQSCIKTSSFSNSK